MNRKVKQQRSKAMDMRFYWVQDRIDQGHFRVYWAPGRTNLADFFTKHHPPHHHRIMRPIVLGQLDSQLALDCLRGCAVPASRAARATHDQKPEPARVPARQVTNTKTSRRILLPPTGKSHAGRASLLGERYIGITQAINH
jgi:hypothetical protein